MIWLLMILLLLIFIMYLLFTSNKKIVNERIIFSPYLNESFYINDKDDNIISDIQLSLNKRDNLFNIKDNKLYKKNKIISEIIRIS